MKLLIAFIVILLLIYFIYPIIEKATLAHPSFRSAISARDRARIKDDEGMTFNDYLLEEKIRTQKGLLDDIEIY